MKGRYDFPDVARDFFISPSAPADLQKLAVDLIWYLYSPDKGGQIDEYGMWDMGHCWLLAQSLHDLIPGSSLHWVVATDFQRTRLGPVPQHVVTKIGDHYLDGTGLYTKSELFQWWENERYSDVSLKPFSSSEARSLSVHCEPGKHRRLVADLKKYLGLGGASLSGPSSARASEAVALAKRAAIHLYQTDPEFVVGGCSDVSEVIAAWLTKRGYKATAVYGAARYGKKAWFLHAWLDLEGERFDPVLWVQDRKMGKYQYTLDPDVAKALRCDVEIIIEGEVENLDRVIT